MTFVQASTGGGGWPMSVFLTPDLKPFFGGTYFPPDNRYGRPGFGADSGADRRGLARTIAPASCESSARRGRAARAIRRRRRAIRRDAGSDGPRFRVPAVPPDVRFAPTADSAARPNFRGRWFSISCCAITRGRDRQEALDMVLETLRAMANGGMHDQLGRRFSSLLGGRALVRSAFREDAVRSGAACDFVSGGVPDHARSVLREDRAQHARLRVARHDASGRRLLFGRRRRQRDRSGTSEGERRRRVLHLDRGGAGTVLAEHLALRGATASSENGNVRRRSARRVHRAKTSCICDESLDDASRSRISAGKQPLCWPSDRSACARISTTRS